MIGSYSFKKNETLETKRYKRKERLQLISFVSSTRSHQPLSANAVMGD